MKPTSMDKENNKRIYEDTITNYGITIVNDKMYLIIDGKKMRLNAFIIKQSRRESN